MNEKWIAVILLTAGLMLSACQTTPAEAETTAAGADPSAEMAAEITDTSAEAAAAIAETSAEEGAFAEEKPAGEDLAMDETRASGAAADDFCGIAADYVDFLIHGQFDELAAHYNAEVAASLDAAATEAAWKQVTGSAGGFVNIKSIEAADDSGQSFSATLTYENAYVVVFLGMDEDGSLNGLWLNQKALEAELLRNTDAYTETAITVGEYELDGVLTMPKEAERPPLVILLQGSGVSDYDETIGAVGNRPFADLAAGLAERGIASIRYNKRFYQKPELADAERYTVADEYLDDAAAAIALAAAYSDEIYLAGHSQGGMIAPAITRDHPELAGMISLAGSPRSLPEIMYDQNMAALEAQSGVSDAQREAVKAQWEQLLQIFAELTEDSGGTILNIPASYWYSLQALDTVTAAQNLTVPMLFLQGDADFQVSVEKDFERWQELLAGKENAQFICYEGLNHLFMPTQGRKDISEYDAPAQVDEQVMEDIAEWIHS